MTPGSASIILSTARDRRESAPRKLYSATPWAAPKPEFQEARKGSITAWKLADLAVLCRDLLSVKPENIKDFEAEMTIVGGQIVYRKEGNYLFFDLGALISPLILAQVIRRTGGVRLGYWLIVVLIVPIAIILFPQESPKAAPSPDSGSAPVSRVLLPLLIAAFFFLHVAAESSYGSWIYTYAVTKKLADELSAAWIATLTYGISLAELFSGTITLASEHLHMTGGVTGFFLVGSSLGAMALPWLIGQFFESVGPQVFPAFLTTAKAGRIVLPAVILILLRRRVTNG